MGWRFRKSFKLLPGIRLNVSRSGVSATIGASPFSLNVGPRGVYSNLNLPGSGITFRERIGQFESNTTQPESGAAPSPDTTPLTPEAIPLPPPAQEIRSASTESMSSEGLEELRKLLLTAYEERGALQTEVAAASDEASTATTQFRRWTNGFLFRRIFRKRFAVIKEKSETAESKLAELQEQLSLTKLATQI